MRWRVCSLALLAWVSLPAVGWAHAELLGSDPPSGASLPASPVELRLFFSEPVTPRLTDVSLLDERGRRVDRAGGSIDSDNGRVLSVPLGDLQSGVYTASYRVLSAVDGHIDRGVITFAVGTTEVVAPQSVTQVLRQPELWTSSVLRWLSYISTLLLFGLPAFRVFVVDRARTALSAAQRSTLDARLMRAMLVCAVLLTLSSVGQIAQQALELADSGSLSAAFAAMESLVVRTRYGGIWLGRALLGVAIVVVLRGQAHLSSAERSQRWGGAVILAGLTLYTLATLSHASAALDGSWVGLLLSWAHLIAVSLWLGGIAGLVLGRSPVLAAPFSRLAAGALAVLVLTGLGQSLLLVGDVRALTETLPGALLLAKLLTVLGAVAIAWQSRRIVQRRRTSTDAADTALLRNVSLELGLSLLTLGATALLVYLPPAWQTYQQTLRGRPLEALGLVGGATWSLRIDPGRPGENDVALQPPPELRGRVSFARLLATAQNADLPPVGVRLEPDDAGVLRTRTPILSVAGGWLLESVVRLESGDDVLVRVPIELFAPGSALTSPPILRGGASTASVVVALGLIALGIGMLVFVTGSLGTRSAEARGLSAATVAIMLLGGYVAFRPTPSEAVTALNQRGSLNPIATSDDSIARGRSIYDADCAECHGPSGRGDGPRITSRGDHLTDLRVHLTAGHTDGDLFEWVSDGIDGTEMPGFSRQLSDEDRWHLVNAIRSIAAEPTP